MSYMDKVTLTSSASGANLDGTRYLGGVNRNSNDHPFVKGYFYVIFGLPSLIFGADGGISAASARQYLMVSAESYTPPGDRQLNIQDVQGQGGVDASFVTGQTISREFSIQYRDYWGAPIFRIHRAWTSYINPYLGGSVMAGNFAASEYKGVCMIIQTKPVVRKASDSAVEWSANDIIKVDYFDGVQPMTDLKSAYDANITDNSFVKPTVQYKFDGFPLDETDSNVIDLAVNILNGQAIFNKTSTLYSNLSSGSIGLNTNTSTATKTVSG